MYYIGQTQRKLVRTVTYKLLNFCEKNSIMKPPLKQGSPDDFQTPPEALIPLYPYLKQGWKIWECACGNKNLVMDLFNHGYWTVGTDIKTGHDYLTYEPDEWDCCITNPPFKYKQQFLERAYSLGKPFAFLLPLTTFETAKRQQLFREYGVEVILFDRRINFETPNKIANSSAWFATAWFTWGLNIGQQLTFVELQKQNKHTLFT